MSKLYTYREFLNESESWYPTFKAQGEYIDKIDHVSGAELKQIAEFLSDIFHMNDVKVGKIQTIPDTSSYTRGETTEKYGVVGTMEDIENTTFSYYWKEGDEHERGWVGKMYTEGRSPGQFMSPFQFLECVEMHYFYSHKWIEDTSDRHLKIMRDVMEKLAIQSPRRGKIIGKKYGI